MKFGASGVLGGRAFWKEYFLKDGQAAREEFANGECVSRVKQIDDIVKKSGTPWFTWYGLKMEELKTMRAAEHWHFRYGSGGAAGSAARVAEGDVY